MNLRKNIILSAPILFLALILSSFSLGYKGSFVKNTHAQANGNCANPQLDAKDEDGPSYGDAFETYGDDPVEIPNGSVFTAVYIKSGQDCFGPYTQDGTYESDINGPDSCYQITGIGTNNLSVSKVGQGQAQTCQAISHIEVEWGDPQSPTPTPTIPDPTPTDVQPTPTDVQPTPTDVQPTPTEAQPTPTETEEEPTLTPTEGVTPTPTITPEPTPTGTVQGTSTGSDDPGDPGTSATGGQVLGASTLADTGVDSSTLYALGLILVGIAVYGISAPKILEEA